MTFLISSTFTDSLARLGAAEQKAVKTTVFDLQVDPESPGLSFHKLDRARDKKFWSVRVSDDIRIIVHKSEASLLVCYVDHHDKAYEWAERRRLDTHPATGAAQLVELREAVIVAKSGVKARESSRNEQPARPLERVPDDRLLRYGVPVEWLQELKVSTEDELLEIAAHLPAEAAEAVLSMATGALPESHASGASMVAEGTRDYGAMAAFLHPDARRRFRIMSSIEELERALDFPWEKWAVFLHPDQRELVEKGRSGPFRVSGSAGTGKTVVALHRAVHLARTHPDARVLLATFSRPLAESLAIKLRAMIEREPRLGERIDVRSLPDLAARLASGAGKRPTVVSEEDILSRIEACDRTGLDKRFTSRFLLSEWTDVVDARGIVTREEYATAPRLGRKSRLSESQRDAIWKVFSEVMDSLRASDSTTESGLFFLLAERAGAMTEPVYDFLVVDEAQDLSFAHLRLLAALGKHRPDSLFFAGDLGQRIFRQPFSWKSAGVDVTGRCATLRVNYRTTQQIRRAADVLLERALSDIDGNLERRDGTVSVMSGPAPVIKLFADVEEEAVAVAAWIKARLDEGLVPQEIGVFVRSARQFDRARQAIRKTGVPFRTLDEVLESRPGHVSVGSMHLSKGLEFKAVAVMACDDGVIPDEERIAALGEGADLEEACVTERQLLYVACTRARDWLLVTGLEPGSEFLEDMKTGS